MNIYSEFEIPNSLVDYLVNISYRSRAAYFEIPKTGCSTIKRTLQNIEVNGESGRLHKNPHSRKHSPLKSLRHVKENGLHLENFFWFTFTRNPYTRILSTYLDKFVMNKWEKRRRAPGLGFDPEKDIPFIEFMKVISKQKLSEMDIHWIPQVFLLPRNVQILDYIGKFESFQPHFREIVQRMERANPNLPGNLFQIIEVRWHQTRSSQLVERYFGEKEKESVRRMYEKDFKTFGYSP